MSTASTTGTVLLPNGATIWYEKIGEGRPLLQIHGSAFGHRNFEKLTPYLTSGCEVIDVDLPGYGGSSGGPSFDSFDGLASLVAELIPALGYQKVDIHGTSFGAMIAVTLAARYPELVDRLVLSCFVARYDQCARMMRSTWKTAAVDSGMEAVADLTSVAGLARSYFDRAEAPAQLQSMREAFLLTEPAAFVAATETIERTDLSGLAPLVTAPCLLLAGAEDSMTPFRPAASGFGMAQMDEVLPDSRYTVLPECGHYLVIEAPEPASVLIHEFLRTTPSTATSSTAGASGSGRVAVEVGK